ncbi:hypothetical protein E2542_SST09669 [Spatholobus suberectus]|nr:hypothetical protein E2542_SST09669 [Spatholobus suberectus]
MITMDVKGITWVGNMYQKFENMFLEAEDVMYEDTVKYIENQMQTVGERVKKLYSDIMGDLLPPDEKVGIELPIDKCADAGFCNKPLQVYKERHVKADTKQTTEDSSIDHGVDNDVTLAASYDGASEADALIMSSMRNSVKESNFSSHSRHYVGSMDIKSNLRIDENPVNKKMAATKLINEITLAETDTCRTSQSCEISNENQNQNHGISVSKPASADMARLASKIDCSNEIENASTKQFPNVPVLVKSAEEEQIDMSSSSCVPFGEPVEQGHKTMQQDHLKLEEACVMVNGDDFQLPPKAGGNLNTNKKKTRQAFSLSKKSARKQEYKELAAWHLKSEKVNGDCMENLDPTLPQDQKKLLLPNMSEPEWELL